MSNSGHSSWVRADGLIVSVNGVAGPITAMPAAITYHVVSIDRRVSFDRTGVKPVGRVTEDVEVQSAVAGMVCDLVWSPITQEWTVQGIIETIPHGECATPEGQQVLPASDALVNIIDGLTPQQRSSLAATLLGPQGNQVMARESIVAEVLEGYFDANEQKTGSAASPNSISINCSEADYVTVFIKCVTGTFGTAVLTGYGSKNRMLATGKGTIGPGNATGEASAVFEVADHEELTLVLTTPEAAASRLMIQMIAKRINAPLNK